MLGPHSTCCAPILLLLYPYNVGVPYIVMSALIIVLPFRLLFILRRSFHFIIEYLLIYVM
jgi:hypothetical protein